MEPFQISKDLQLIFYGQQKLGIKDELTTVTVPYGEHPTGEESEDERRRRGHMEFSFHFSPSIWRRATPSILGAVSLESLFKGMLLIMEAWGHGRA